MADTAAAQNTCFKCGEAGHWSSACPKHPGTANRTLDKGSSFPAYETTTPVPTSQRPPDAVTCHKCGQKGHWSSACTNTDRQRAHTPVTGTKRNQKGPENIVCYKCGDVGHWSSACTATQARAHSPNSGGPASQSRSTDVVCYKCGNPGHFSSACTVPRSEWLKTPLNSGQVRHSHDDSGPTTTPRPQQPVIRGACYKCGQTSHWTRDCTVPKSEWITTRPPESNPQVGQGSQHFSATPIMGVLRAPAPPKVGRKRKLVVEDLKERNALPIVYNTFLDDFRKQFRGKGHEVSDLRTLLEMYGSWQRQVAPRFEFGEFLDNLEQLGTRNALKVELRELREAPFQELAALKERQEAAAADQHVREAGVMHVGAAHSPAPPKCGPTSQNDFPDEDELLELMEGVADLDADLDIVPEEITVTNPAQTTAPAQDATAQQPTEAPMLDDDEIDALLGDFSQKASDGGQVRTPLGPPRGAAVSAASLQKASNGSPSGCVELDDEEVLDLLRSQPGPGSHDEEPPNLHLESVECPMQVDSPRSAGRQSSAKDPSPAMVSKRPRCQQGTPPVVDDEEIDALFQSQVHQPMDLDSNPVDPIHGPDQGNQTNAGNELSTEATGNRHLDAPELDDEEIAALFQSQIDNPIEANASSSPSSELPSAKPSPGQIPKETRAQGMCQSGLVHEAGGTGLPGPLQCHAPAVEVNVTNFPRAGATPSDTPNSKALSKDQGLLHNPSEGLAVSSSSPAERFLPRLLEARDQEHLAQALQSLPAQEARASSQGPPSYGASPDPTTNRSQGAGDSHCARSNSPSHPAAKSGSVSATKLQPSEFAQQGMPPCNSPGAPGNSSLHPRPEPSRLTPAMTPAPSTNSLPGRGLTPDGCTPSNKAGVLGSVGRDPSRLPCRPRVATNARARGPKHAAGFPRAVARSQGAGPDGGSYSLKQASPGIKHTGRQAFLPATSPSKPALDFNLAGSTELSDEATPSKTSPSQPRAALVPALAGTAIPLLPMSDKTNLISNCTSPGPPTKASPGLGSTHTVRGPQASDASPSASKAGQDLWLGGATGTRGQVTLLGHSAATGALNLILEPSMLVSQTALDTILAQTDDKP
eukprot:jgi/Botrbrau1/15854/Bobra.40_1s0038.1